MACAALHCGDQVKRPVLATFKGTEIDVSSPSQWASLFARLP